jgi:hypothetical protein
MDCDSEREGMEKRKPMGIGETNPEERRMRRPGMEEDRPFIGRTNPSMRKNGSVIIALTSYGVTDTVRRWRENPPSMKRFVGIDEQHPIIIRLTTVQPLRYVPL